MARCDNCGAGMRHYNSGNGYHVPVCPECGNDPTSQVLSVPDSLD